MFEEFEIYKDKLKNKITNKQYSKKTPLNTYTSNKLLKHFTFDPKITYIEIHTLNKKDKDKILIEFFEFIKIKEYKNYFDIIFKLDDNDIKTVLDALDLYYPESITIYESNNNEEFEKLIKKTSKIDKVCNYKITLNLEEQTIKINNNINDKNIIKQIKILKKHFE